MGEKSKIEWLRDPKTGVEGATWNCLYGCSRKSVGCENCYAERQCHRFAGKGQRHEGLTVIRGGRPGWTGKIDLRPDRLDIPLRWQRPRRIFVNSLSDLFHENVPFEFIAATFGVMAAARHHQFQVLTKRAERMDEFFKWLIDGAGTNLGGPMKDSILADLCGVHSAKYGVSNRFWTDRDGEVKPGYWDGFEWPLKNVWLGVSAENQKTADERIPILLKCPAAVRWVSAEPLLGPIDLESSIGGTRWIGGQRGCGMTHRGNGSLDCPREPHHHHDDRCQPGLNWIVVGGESGPLARPMDDSWVKLLRDQCQDAEIPFHFKQFGVLANNPNFADPTAKENGGSIKGGRTLSGRTWDEEPAVA